MVTSSTEQDQCGSDRRQVVIGLLADPEGAPREVTDQLQQSLPDALAQHFDDGTSWVVLASYERLPPGSSGHVTILDLGQEHMRKHEWHVTICITDLLLRSRDNRPLIADVSCARQTALVSLPAFGGMHLTRRVRNVVLQVLAELVGQGMDTEFGEARRPVDRKPFRNRLTGRFEHIAADEDEDIDARIVASRGWMRLLVGMVRTNRPWRVIHGLTGAAAGALAFSTFYLINSGLWELSDAIGPARLALATVGSLVILVSWLIVRHQLWESPRRSGLPHERTEVVLFNASTVLTLAVGMVFMYVGLFVLILAAIGLLLSGDVLANYLQDSTASLASYLKIAWFATCTGGIAGALGSSFDNEDSVREAAYSYRERERREQREQERQVEERQAAESVDAESGRDTVDDAEVPSTTDGQSR